MSQMATEPAPRRASSSGGNAFTRKIGPLPMYGWLAIVGGGVLIWAFIANRNASNAASSQAGSQANASQVPDFINQTYTTVTPPSAPAPAAPEDNDTTNPPPVSRVNRSPAVKHKIHQINQIHNKNEAASKKKVKPGTGRPTGQSGGPARKVPPHPARKK